MLVHVGYINNEAGSLLVRLDKPDRARVEVRYELEGESVKRSWPLESDILVLNSWQLTRHDKPERLEIEVFNSLGDSLGIKSLDVYAP